MDKKLFISKYILFICVIWNITCCATGGGIRSGSFFQKPKVKIQKVSFVSISLRDLKLKLHLEVFNPNIIGVKLNSFKYVIEVENEQLASGAEVDLINIKSQENTSLIVPVTINFSGIPEVIKGFIQKQSIDYLVKAAVGVNFIGGTVFYIPIRKKGRFALPDRKTLWNQFKENFLPFIEKE